MTMTKEFLSTVQGFFIQRKFIVSLITACLVLANWQATHITGRTYPTYHLR